MIALALVSALAGMALGLRFKALVLVPAIATVVAAALIFGMARGETTWLVALTVAACVAALQIGYLAGAIIHHVLRSARTSRVRGPSFVAHGR